MKTFIHIASWMLMFASLLALVYLLGKGIALVYSDDASSFWAIGGLAGLAAFVGLAAAGVADETDE